MSDDPNYLLALEQQKRWNAEPSTDLHSSEDAQIVDNNMPLPSKQPLRANTTINSKFSSNLDEDYLNRTQNLVHPLWESLDPTPDVLALFSAFDDKFFQSRLKSVTLEWSKRMYSCAGICYLRRNSLGMDITIRLSEPLLKLRPRKDLIETMLHEMIHAYCFVLNIREGNGGHGPNFKKIMYAINKVAGTNITVYHTFYDEVDIYKQHWWRCNGICTNRAPFFGYVKCTSNRAPSANDQWWAAHQESCGGTFMKIKNPEKPKTSKSKEVKPNNAEDNKTNGVKELASGSAGGVHSNVGADSTKSFVGSGSQLNSYNSVKSPNLGEKVDRGRLCDLWSSRFESKTKSIRDDILANKDSFTNSIKLKRSLKSDAELLTGGAKHQGLSAENDATDSASNTWVVLDDDLKYRELPTETISISSDEEDDDEAVQAKVEVLRTTSTLSKTLTLNERQILIKNEILEDTVDLKDDDIILIDDEYSDEPETSNELNMSAAVESANTSIIDEFFGDDSLLKEFKEENDVAPTFSCNIPNPNDDIITCPVCQGKMKRSLFGAHMDGCTGIAVKVVLPKHTMKKLSATSKIVKPKPQKRPTLPSNKDILRNAGYTEQNLANITSASSTDEDLLFGTDSANQPTSPNANSTIAQLSPETRNSGRITRNTQVSCPNCQRHVLSKNINEHLDKCLTI